MANMTFKEYKDKKIELDDEIRQLANDYSRANFGVGIGDLAKSGQTTIKDTARDALTREILRPWEWPGDHVICERYRWNREMDPQSGIAFQAGVCLSRDDNDIVNVKMYVTPYSDGKKTNLGSCMQEGDVDEIQIS